MLALKNFFQPCSSRRASVVAAEFMAIMLVLILTVAAFSWPGRLVGAAHSRDVSARLSKHSTLHIERPNPLLNLVAGHDLITAFTGPANLQNALESNQAEARSLASADFDEDGVPDLIGGYAFDGRGIITMHRGNIDSIYPHAPEAKERKGIGAFTSAPFLSPASAIEASAPVDFLGGGDFNADGHADIVFASRGDSILRFLPGDGKGDFANEIQIPLDGSVTALIVGEINRRDGLPDVIVGVNGPEGSRVCVFESPLGAMPAAPEIIAAPEQVTSLALGQLDDNFAMDLLIASGNELLLVHGRDRKLSLPEEDQKAVAPPGITERAFSFAIRDVTTGDFNGDGFTDVALLTNEGSVEVLAQPAITDREWQQMKARAMSETETPNAVESASSSTQARNDITVWSMETFSGASAATSLISARVSSSTPDDLLLLDPSNRRIVTISARAESPNPTSFELANSPTAVLPMRLDTDALTDLVVLQSCATAPTIALTTSGADSAPVHPEAFLFSNPQPLNILDSSIPPTRAEIYPSTIQVSGLTGKITKMRVGLNNLSHQRPSDIDILLVGPSGQRLLLLSDAGGSIGITNVYLAFDDSANTTVPVGGGIASGTYKPTDVNDGSNDIFPSPAPQQPFSTALSVFNSTDPNGTWSLYVVDDQVGNAGVIAGGWSLSIVTDSSPTQSPPIIVNNTNDGGPGSLRQAIIDANLNIGSDVINFNIGSGAQTITPSSSLPIITEPVTIDGTTQPGFSGNPLIELNCINFGTNSVGFNLATGSSDIRGLVINQFSGAGIQIRTGGSNIVEGNFIGTDLTGATSKGNSKSNFANGVSIDTASNIVGGTTSAARNLISNVWYGVLFDTFNSDPATLNLIQGNFIGTDVAGTKTIGNTTGVTTRSAPGSPNNTIGGTAAGARNLISGNNTGVDIVYGPSAGTLVQGNFIGTDITGTKPIANTEGIELDSPNCAVGGTSTAARNVISGNIFQGILIRDSSSSGNLIQGNFLGTDVNGTASVSNDYGIGMIFSATMNTIGGNVVSARNVISGNSIAGIDVGATLKATTIQNLIQGNYIGTDVTGTGRLGNGTSSFFDSNAGIVIPANATADRIIQNRIAYDHGAGVRLSNPPDASDSPGLKIQIVENEIFGNDSLGIDLGNTGITANDLKDPDTGPNNLQNFPVLTSAVRAPRSNNGRLSDPVEPDSLTINGTLNSTPNQTFTIHWYFSGDASCTNNEEATVPLAFGKILGVMTDTNGDAAFSFPFDFPIGTNNGVINCTATDADGNTSEFSACFAVNNATPTPTPTATPTPTPTPSVQFSSASYSAIESVGSRSITVIRTGNTASAATVDYATSDSAGSNSCNQATGQASARCDYETTLGTLRFASGETSKTILIPIIDDSYAEGSENFTITLSNPSGISLVSPSVATITITDNDATTNANPIDQANVYVRVNYIDFLNREPDASGLNFWTNEIISCGSNSSCVDVKRINVSAAFFLSIEFQQTGYLVERIYKVAYGDVNAPSTFGGAHQLPVPVVRLNEFLRDTQQIGQGVVVGQSGWEAVLESNKQSFALDFVQRSRFPTALATTMSPQAFVDKLYLNAGVTPTTTDRNAAISEFGSATNTTDVAARARVLRKVADDPTLVTNESNRAFVLMQFFGYLRRNPNDAPDPDYSGYDFWLTKLNQFNGNYINAEMVKAFITSNEYRNRFGP